MADTGARRRLRRMASLLVAAIASICTVFLLPVLVNVLSDTDVWPITWFKKSPRLWAAGFAVVVFLGGKFLLPRVLRVLDGAPADVHAAGVRAQLAAYARKRCDDAVEQRSELLLPVRLLWTAGGGRPVAQRDAVYRSETGKTWAEQPLTGDQDTLAETLRGLPHGQMVILGEAGAGKSACAILLARDLAGTEPVPDRIPLLIPAGGWDPRTQGVLDYVAAQLPERFRPLIQRGTVLPVLDGLDELRPDLHAPALEQLRRHAGPFVVTCRGAEYDQAVDATGSFLLRALVVEIQPVVAEDARTYLTHRTMEPHRWRPVFEAMEEPPLSGVLASPLMVTVAAIAYEHRRTDPAELLRLPDRAAVEKQLLDGFVNAAFKNHEPDRAHRWLSTLAHQLDRTQTRTLRWGRLEPDLFIRDTFPWLFGLLVLVSVAQFVGPLVLIFLGPAGVPTSPLPGPILFAATGGVLFAFGLTRRWHRYRLPEAALWFGYGCALGFLVSVLNVDRGLGLLVGVVAGLLLAALPYRSPWPPAGAGRHGFLPPREVPARWRYPVITAVLHGSAAFVLFAGSYRLVGRPADALQVGLIAAAVFAVGAALVTGLLTWVVFRITHLRLAMRGRLPRRLRSFLDDAYHRGVLRRTGDAWQFRHAILLEHLARQVRHQLILEAGEGWHHANLLIERGEIGALRRLAARDVAAAYRLADQFRAQGRPAEAMTVLRPHSTSDRLVALRLAELLLAEGTTSEATPIFDRLARDGDWAAAWRRVQLRMAEGDLIGVRVWARSGDSAAIRQLIDEFAARGDLDEVAGMVLERAGQDDWFSVRHGMAVLIVHRRLDDAERVLAVVRSRAADLARRAYDDEHAPGASADVAVVSRYREPADSGKRLAVWSAARLTEVSAADGRIDGLRRRPATPDDDFAAVRCLAELLDATEAIELLRLHRGKEAVDLVLAERLAGLGEYDEALRLLARHAKAEFSEAGRRRAEILVAAGRTGDLAGLAARGDLHAAAGHVALLARAGRIAEAVDFLTHRRGSGAATLFADLALLDRGRVEELRAGAETGGWLDARRLAVVLDRAKEQAEEIRSAAEPCRRALLLALSGRLEEAVRAVDTGTNHDDQVSGPLLAILRGELEALEDRLIPWSGFVAPVVGRAGLLIGRGRRDQAIAELSRVAGYGDVAAHLLVRLLSPGVAGPDRDASPARARGG